MVQILYAFGLIFFPSTRLAHYKSIAWLITLQMDDAYMIYELMN